MGTWSTAINGNDTFQDVYQSFFLKYNEGMDPHEIARETQLEFSIEFEDLDDKHNALFALALALWETKSLDQQTLNRVRQIIESGDDLKLWVGENATPKVLSKREKLLTAFLKKISTEKEKPKRRKKISNDFHQVYLINIVAPDRKKVFEISEQYVNKSYVQTGSSILWNTGEMQGGGGICYFTGQGQSISARWIDSQTLEITHHPAIQFTKKETSFYFCGDECQIIYIAKAN